MRTCGYTTRRLLKSYINFDLSPGFLAKPLDYAAITADLRASSFEALAAKLQNEGFLRRVRGVVQRVYYLSCGLLHTMPGLLCRPNLCTRTFCASYMMCAFADKVFENPAGLKEKMLVRRMEKMLLSFFVCIQVDVPSLHFELPALLTVFCLAVALFHDDSRAPKVAGCGFCPIFWEVRESVQGLEDGRRSESSSAHEVHVLCVWGGRGSCP